MSVSVDGVVHLYPGRPPVLALDDVTLHVPTGSLLAVLGQSGSGKTSLLRVIAGFERPQNGQVVLGDRTVVDGQVFVPPNKRRIGIVPQEGALFPHLDVAGNVSFGLRRLERPARRARVAELLDLVGLAGYEHRRPHQLSGGQQQRVAVARALAPRPDVVLLDEPFSALDAALRSSVRDEVADLLRTAGATAVLVTHDRAEAMSVADEIAVLSHGRVVQTGSPGELYRRPADRETAELLGDANVVTGTADGSTVTCLLGRIALAEPASGRVEVLVRPEMIVRTGHDQWAVSAVVVAYRVNGADATVVLELGDRIRLSARWPATESLPPGSAVRVGVTGAVWPLRGRPRPQPEDAGDRSVEAGNRRDLA